MRQGFLVSCVLAGVMAASAPARADEAQPMFRGGPQLTGVYGERTPRRLDGVRFQFDAGAPLRNAPIVAAGRLYVGAADGTFYALDARTGAVAWRASSAVGVTSTAAIVREQVLFTTRDNRLHALATADGREVWSVSLGEDSGNNYWDFYNSAPIPYEGVVYVGSGDGAVYAIDPEDGHTLWRTPVGARVRSTPAVSASVIVVGTQQGYVYGLDRRSGRVRWRFATDGVRHTFEDQHNDTTSVLASATIAEGVVAIGGRDGQLYGLDLATGAKRWQTTHDGSSWILSTASADGELYVGSGSARIVQGADLRTGREHWRYATDGAVFDSISISGDALLFGDFGGALHAVDRTNGHEMWRFALGDRMFSTPVIADGVVYASSDAGVLYALNTSEGAANTPNVHRYVLRAGPGPQGETWFPENVESAVFAAFEAQHYEAIDEAAAVRIMNEQIAQASSNVIVFGDNKLPVLLRDGYNAQSLLRRYLEAGGAVVFLSQNPAALRYDENGALAAVDESLAASMLGLQYDPRPNDSGYHISHPTERGEQWGLHDEYVTSGVMPADGVTTVLGLDEFGHASQWTRAYGADQQGLLVQLAVPRNRVTDLTPDINVIDFALANRGTP